MHKKSQGAECLWPGPGQQPVPDCKSRLDDELASKRRNTISSTLLKGRVDKGARNLQPIYTWQFTNIYVYAMVFSIALFSGL